MLASPSIGMSSVSIILFFCGFVAEINGASLKIGLAKTKHPEVDSRSNQGGLVLNDAFGQRVTNRKNILYHGNITLGNPPQEFSVIFDTGSDITWVPGVGCHVSNFNGDLETESLCHRQIGLYDPTKSSTSTYNNERFTIGYQTGSANGFVYSDVLRFGGVREAQKELGPVRFGVALQTSYLDEGVFGLAFPHPLLTADSIFIRAMEKNFWDEPVFTAYYRDCSSAYCADGGQITLGDYDRDNCEDVKLWVPIIPSVKENGKDYMYWWMFDLDSMSIDGQQFWGPIKAFTDTGNSMIRFPQHIYDRFVQQLRPHRIQGEHPWGYENHLMVPCDRRFNLTISALGEELVIPAETLFYRERESNDRLCRVSVVPYASEDTVILGDAFLRSYCQVHDMEHKRLGIAPLKKFNKPTQYKNWI